MQPGRNPKRCEWCRRPFSRTAKRHLFTVGRAWNEWLAEHPNRLRFGVTRPAFLVIDGACKTRLHNLGAANPLFTSTFRKQKKPQRVRAGRSGHGYKAGYRGRVPQKWKWKEQARKAHLAGLEKEAERRAEIASRDGMSVRDWKHLDKLTRPEKVFDFMEHLDEMTHPFMDALAEL